MADPIRDSTGRNDVQGGRRPRHGAKRPYRVEFSLTGEEFELLEAAAGRAGRAHAAEVALAAARGGPAAADTSLRELLRELIRASGLVRRIGVNLNQAVARLNATGQRSGDLLPLRRREPASRGTPRRGGGRSPEGAAVISGTHSSGPRSIPPAVRSSGRAFR
jgi:hypothetical protein